MAFLLDTEELKPGLIIFRRADVKHKRWYCRVKVPKADRYKVVSLKTSDRETALNAALECDGDIRNRIKYDVPIFNRPFCQIAKEYAETQKERAETKHISKVRAENVESAIRTLNLYVGSKQIHVVTQADWNRYPIWRRQQARRVVERPKSKLKLRKGVERPKAVAKPKKEDKQWRVSDWTIRAEMSVFRSIMVYAVSRKFIPESQIPKGKLHTAEERREEFTREEYRALHTRGRAWKAKATTPASKWYREMVYNFVLVMCNTGMRPTEAKNLRWRDVQITTINKDTKGRDQTNAEAKKAEQDRKVAKGRSNDKADEFRKIAVLNVRGKDKFRNLVAPSNVVEYLERIRAIAKASGLDDYVFTTIKGKQAKTLYSSLITNLLTDAKLLTGAAGTVRSTYCFRHTYATIRLGEGIDVYILAEQMGTSVQMIEDHYGHINPVKNADRILLGMHTWETEINDAAEGAADGDRVNKVAAKPKAAKSRAAQSGRVNAGPAVKGMNLNSERHKPRR